MTIIPIRGCLLELSSQIRACVCFALVVVCFSGVAAIAQDLTYNFSCDLEGWWSNPHDDDSDLTYAQGCAVHTTGDAPTDPYLAGPVLPVPARRFIVARLDVSGAPEGTNPGAVFAWVRTPDMEDDVILRKPFSYTNGDQTLVLDMSTGVEHITGDPTTNPFFGSAGALVSYWRFDLPDIHNAYPNQTVKLDWTYVAEEANVMPHEQPCTEPPLEYDWTTGTGLYSPVPHSERQVGIAYTTWHRPGTWQRVWGTPELGQYFSNDRAVIRQHATWIAEAGIDFIWIDWSNNVNYDPATMHDQRPDFAMIEDSTTLIFEEYAQMASEGLPHPRVSIFTGCPDQSEAINDGRLQAKLDQIYDDYVSDPRYRPIMQDYLGKPLMVIYLGTPNPFQSGTPQFDDSRFTLRWMTGFVTEQPSLYNTDRVSHYGYWSWEDRGPQTFTLHDNQPEAMLALASWRQQGFPGDAWFIPACGRQQGQTLQQEWARVRQIGPRFAMVVSWNEWTIGEQPNAEVSKDIEPSLEWGHEYLELLAEQIRLFKNPPEDSSNNGSWMQYH